GQWQGAVTKRLSTYEITRFKEPEELARAVAAQWLKEVEALGGGAAPYGVALSGGRIAGRFLAAVTEMAKSRRRFLDRVHFFWGDERCVAPTDPESNFRLARELLLAPLAISDSRIHRLRGEAPPD